MSCCGLMRQIPDVVRSATTSSSARSFRSLQTSVPTAVKNYGVVRTATLKERAIIIRPISGNAAITEMQRVRIVKKQLARSATLHSAFRSTFAINAIATNWRQSFRIPCGRIGRHNEQCVWSAKNSRPEAKKHGNASSAPTSSLKMASQQACGKTEGIPNDAPCAKHVVDHPVCSSRSARHALSAEETHASKGRPALRRSRP